VRVGSDFQRFLQLKFSQVKRFGIHIFAYGRVISHAQLDMMPWCLCRIVDSPKALRKRCQFTTESSQSTLVAEWSLE